MSRLAGSDVVAGTSPVPVVVHGLTKRLRGVVAAVDALDLCVGQGQVMGLTGPAGAGKSTVLRMMLGLVRPDAGYVEIFGERVRPGAKVLRRVGALVDGPGFVPHLSGLVNLRLAWRTTGRRETEADLGRALELAGLGSATEVMDRPYKTYPKAVRYQLGLARALLGKPDLLLLDAPSTDIEPTGLVEIRRAIEGASGHGATVLFSSRQLSAVQWICSHAAVVCAGKLVLSGPVIELVGQSASLEDAYLAALAAAAPPGEPSPSSESSHEVTSR